MRFPSEMAARRGPMAEMIAGAVADLGRSEAYLLAADCLRATHGGPAKATDAFLRTLREERAGRVLMSLMGEEAVQRLALDFLASVAADMRGDALNASPDGQSLRASNEARRPSPAGDAPHAAAGQTLTASHEAMAHAPAAAPQAGTKGHDRVASNEAIASAPAVPAPSPQARATALAARATLSKNLLDTYLIDGTPIGDLRMDQVRRLAGERRMQAELLGAIAAHAGGAAGHMKVREVYTNVRLTRDLARAERKAHAIAC